MKKLRNSWTLLLPCNFWVILELMCFLYKVYFAYVLNLVYETAFYFALYILILDKNLWMGSHKLINLSLDDRKVHFHYCYQKGKSVLLANIVWVSEWDTVHPAFWEWGFAGQSWIRDESQIITHTHTHNCSISLPCSIWIWNKS